MRRMGCLGDKTGMAFQTVNKKRVHHEINILVNTVILPCALDLARYYGN
jgi:hypothetical protein